ncbi:hypothetical protein T439DRAFT_326575 [Meredithblackwellia eburnea MCA 4105]
MDDGLLNDFEAFEPFDTTSHAARQDRIQQARLEAQRGYRAKVDSPAWFLSAEPTPGTIRNDLFTMHYNYSLENYKKVSDMGISLINEAAFKGKGKGTGKGKEEGKLGEEIEVLDLVLRSLLKLRTDGQQFDQEEIRLAKRYSSHANPGLSHTSSLVLLRAGLPLESLEAILHALFHRSTLRPYQSQLKLIIQSDYPALHDFVETGVAPTVPSSTPNSESTEERKQDGAVDKVIPSELSEEARKTLLKVLALIMKGSDDSEEQQEEAEPRGVRSL